MVLAFLCFHLPGFQCADFPFGKGLQGNGDMGLMGGADKECAGLGWGYQVFEGCIYLPMGLCYDDPLQDFYLTMVVIHCIFIEGVV